MSAHVDLQCHWTLEEFLAIVLLLMMKENVCSRKTALFREHLRFISAIFHTFNRILMMKQLMVCIVPLLLTNYVMLEGVIPLVMKLVICKAQTKKHITIKEINEELQKISIGQNDKANKPVCYQIDYRKLVLLELPIRNGVLLGCCLC